MTLDQFAAEVRAIAAAGGAVADEWYWSPNVWRQMFENGYTPADAWEAEQHAALRAL